MSFRNSRRIIVLAALAPWAIAGAQSSVESPLVPAPPAQLMPMAGQIAPEKHNSTNPSVDTQQLSAFELDPKARPQSDSRFMTEAALSSRAQMNASLMAQQRTSDPQVRRFAEQVLNNQQALAPGLASLAANKSVALPVELDSKRRLTLQRLSDLDGPAFDRAYVEQMVHDQDQTVMFYKGQGALTHDADVRDYVSQSLPSLQRQDRIARAVLVSPGEQAETLRALPD